MSSDNIPEVFIVESLYADDRENQRKEGDIIARILKMGGREPEYRYVKTREEFRGALNEFAQKNYRYLHLSCHGASDHLSGEFGEIYFHELGPMIKDVLDKFRLFVSACETVNHEDHLLANALLWNTKCISVIGSAEPIDFDDAAMFWSTFYYQAYREKKNELKLSRSMILKVLKKTTSIFPLKINYYSTGRRKEIDLYRFMDGKKQRL